MLMPRVWPWPKWSHETNRRVDTREGKGQRRADRPQEFEIFAKGKKEEGLLGHDVVEVCRENADVVPREKAPTFEVNSEMMGIKKNER